MLSNMDRNIQPHPILVNGEWLRTADVYADINPSNLDECVGEFHLASSQHAVQAVDAAVGALPGWSQQTPASRAEVLDRVGQELHARRSELGELLAREEGKTLAEATAEVQRAAQIFKFHAHAAVAAAGEIFDSVRAGLRVDVSREPVGVVGIITPWNFPIAIPAWKIAPALAYGNTVVFKSAESVPASAWALVEILHRQGLPPGVLNFVPGPGKAVGQVLLDDRRVDAISFTGSTATGARVAAACSARQARYQTEMGGKNPLVILDDADLEIALDCAVQGAYFSTGQRCTASSRLIATPQIYARFRELLIERVRALRVGHALDAQTQIGPVVDEIQLEQDRAYIELGIAEGASLASGGDLLRRPTRGHFLSPALFVDADNGMRICQEEIFGPVAALIPARDAEHALTLANETPFGLSAGVCTASLKLAHHFQRHLKAGMVMVNAPTAGVDYHVPFGGSRGSSFGPREQGTHAKEFFTQVKTTYIRP
ncbi:aldehyde dehydrogenase family protein [Roseateles violae]|uniref:Aldehyde dehydrogenase family protein n=1 Tax=Roseateles violae TaxID=3058042 RepID=A0ABT8DT23_9BURK|nr:aldehyde dehydrogenase family protein [Pelomonas sp. PFR6]MDN3921460.1 aldehyde dehydrogenase family protein [Pelomonas sp. PFR6]